MSHSTEFPLPFSALFTYPVQNRSQFLFPQGTSQMLKVSENIVTYCLLQGIPSGNTYCMLGVFSRSLQSVQ